MDEWMKKVNELMNKLMRKWMNKWMEVMKQESIVISQIFK